MKSAPRTHYSRIEPEDVQTETKEESILVTVSFRFYPWDSPSAYPAGYSADALTAFQEIWDAGVAAMQTKDDTDNGLRVKLEHTNLWLRVHNPVLCEGRPCTVHNRSDHSMRSFPQHWRGDRGMMERICSHGVGHPDPDEKHSPNWTEGDGVHGCDGCCH